MSIFTGRVRPTLRLLLVGLALALLTSVSFLLANQLHHFEVLKNVLESYGSLTVLVLAIIAGLNAVVPVPAATFTPVFLEAGLSLPLIIAMLVIGTTIADLIGYGLGRISRRYFDHHHRRFITRLETFQRNHAHWTLPLVAMYAAVVPLPNELILLPLGVVGVRFRYLLIALIVGNIIHQSILAFGFQSVFDVLF